MAYYAAVISLKRTLTRLLISSHISIHPLDREMIRLTSRMVCSLQRLLDKFHNRRNDIRSKRLESLHEQIRDAAYRLEDAFDSHVSDQFLSPSERLEDQDYNSLTFSLDFSNEALKREVENFADMVKKMKDECSQLSKYSLPEEEEEEEEDYDDDDDDEVDSSGIGFIRTETMTVGLSTKFEDLKCWLLYSGHTNFSLFGMIGIGKTYMAKKIFHDPEVCSLFNCRLWVKVGQKFQLKKILLCLLAQLDYDVDSMQEDEDEKLGNHLSTSLKSRRSLIVLDDVWDKSVLVEVKEYISFAEGKSLILATTMLRELAPDGSFSNYKIQFLDEEESWYLLREKVFGKEPCPYQLEKAGRKIAEDCDGLPLLIVTVANLLSKVERTVEHWTKIAEGEDKSTFIEAYDKISNRLLRSYKHLPQDSKAHFLYMAVFPIKHAIRTPKLCNLWLVEDICESITDARSSLVDLLCSNVVLLDQYAVGVKTCKLHSSFWYACVKQSWKEKFLHVINSYADSNREGAISRRRLAIRNNVLFGIKDAYDSIESISNARSLMCTGPYHQYPVRVCFGLRFLNTLDVLSIRFYKFPNEVLKLIHLRYLALTYNGKIPPSISKLWNLEHLIVRRHLSIKFHGDWSYLPVEIWNLKELSHLQVTGNYLPYFYDALLPNLLKISSINAYNCTEEIFRRIPNLEKLGIQIELAPDSDAIDPLSCFDNLFRLGRLESLKCVIVNPNPARPQLIKPPASITTFPSNLNKLSLSGFGYSWNYMRVIGKLPNLYVLKLRNYAFRGPEWEVHENEFLKLIYLLVEDLDLVHITSCAICGFPLLQVLTIEHCYKLKTIPLVYNHSLYIKLVDSPLIAKYVQENQGHLPGEDGTLYIHSSWDSVKLKA